MTPETYQAITGHLSQVAQLLAPTDETLIDGVIALREQCFARVVTPFDYLWSGEEAGVTPSWAIDRNGGWSTATQFGRIFTVKTGQWRYEYGRRDERLAMIGAEPAGKKFRYRLAVAPHSVSKTLDHKIVVFQFWSKPERPPRLSLEFHGKLGVQRLVHIGDTGGRSTLVIAPLGRQTWELQTDGAHLTGFTNHNGVLERCHLPLTYADGRPTPTFKWGIYLPAIREGYETPGVSVIVENVERKEMP